VSTRTDAHHGRQGGNWLPDDYVPVDERASERCDRCGGPLLVGQFRRHYLCDSSSIAGRKCTCPPGCTDLVVGDGGTCARDCEVCRRLAGATYGDVPGWKKSKKKDDGTEVDDDTPEIVPTLFAPGAAS
jgi:hypothetical protein